MYYIASQHGALVNGYDPFMAKDSTIGPFRVDAQLRADLERMAELEGEDVSVADVVRAAASGVKAWSLETTRAIMVRPSGVVPMSSTFT